METEANAKKDLSEETLAECQKQKDEYLKGWQRERADFLNYKKGEIERISVVLEYNKKELILSLLPVLDSFDFAEKSLPEDLKQVEPTQGFLRAIQKLKDFLKAQGVEVVKSEGEIFDPSLHEVVEEIEKEGLSPGTILEETQRGYAMLGKLLRPAKVKVVK